SFLKERVLLELIETGTLWTWTQFTLCSFQNGRLLPFSELLVWADLIVKFIANSSRNPHDTPGLQIQLMEPGFCSTDVAYFEHSCYTISSAQRSLKAELTAICRDSGLTQLATFNSSSALQNFVAQSQRTRVGTGLDAHRKTPLNLTQPVRIGILHDQLTDSIFYLSNSNGELELKPLVDSNNLYYNVRPTSSRFSCGSLKLAQSADGTEVSFGVVEFVSCSESLPALLSFRDTARNCCCGCSARAVLSQIESAESHDSLASTGHIDPYLLHGKHAGAKQDFKFSP
uniref:LAM_G_DOMAIN domain-containing protein n=1 Tax=Macrostomum lignano TaxID=282301 RepID=A0A1I8IME4_9PLAT